MKSDFMRGYNDLMILYLLKHEDSYGYEIAKQIKSISKDKYSIKETTLYSAFARLEKKGFIISYEGTKTEGKKRTYYAITDDGRNYYLEMISEWYVAKEVVDFFIDKEGKNESN